MLEDDSEYASGIEMNFTVQFLLQSAIKTVDAAKNVNQTVNFSIEINKNEQRKKGQLLLLKAPLKKKNLKSTREFLLLSGIFQK